MLSSVGVADDHVGLNIAVVRIPAFSQYLLLSWNSPRSCTNRSASRSRINLTIAVSIGKNGILGIGDPPASSTSTHALSVWCASSARERERERVMHEPFSVSQSNKLDNRGIDREERHTRHWRSSSIVNIYPCIVSMMRIIRTREREMRTYRQQRTSYCATRVTPALRSGSNCRSRPWSVSWKDWRKSSSSSWSVRRAPSHSESASHRMASNTTPGTNRDADMEIILVT